MKIKNKLEDVVVESVSYGFMAIFAIITLLPFTNILAKSFSVEWAVVSGKVGVLPVGFQLDTMKYVITAQQFIRSFQISTFVAVAGTILGVFLTGITAYPLSKKHLSGIKAVLLFFVFTMLFNGGLIPNYLLMKQLGFINTLWPMILPNAISVFNMLIIKNYYESLPESLEESAKLDGASNISVLFNIIFPLSIPVFATITLFTVVGLWNDYFAPMIYINNPNLKPLQLYLRDIVTEAADAAGSSGKSIDDLMNVPADGVRAATIIASTVPILLVYPFMQKYFIKGILIGSVKG